MRLSILPETNAVRELYENHGHFHQGDAGLDLFCPDEVKIPPFTFGHVIDLKIRCSALSKAPFSAVDAPTSYYLYPRSSMAKTPLRLANSVGIIDSEYRGNIMAMVDNLSSGEYTVKSGTRLFQICAPDLGGISFDLVDSLSRTGRGDGGFGSTG